MNTGIRDKQRKETMQRRQKPGNSRIIRIPFGGFKEFKIDANDPPTELHLEPTGDSGETALWLDDHFWMELIQAWSKHPLSIHFLPTPDSIPHPVILHQINMLRRVTPSWRLIGHCYLSDLSKEGRITQVALSVYHEVRIIDGIRPGKNQNGRPLKIQDALSKIRQVQTANNRTTPIVACCQDSNLPDTQGIVPEEVLSQIPVQPGV